MNLLRAALILLFIYLQACGLAKMGSARQERPFRTASGASVVSPTHPVASPAPATPPSTPPAASQVAIGPIQLKYSSGSISKMASSDMALSARVSPTRRILKSSDMSAQMTMNQTKVLPTLYH